MISLRLYRDSALAVVLCCLSVGPLAACQSSDASNVAAYDASLGAQNAGTPAPSSTTVNPCTNGQLGAKLGVDRGTQSYVVKNETSGCIIAIYSGNNPNFDLLQGRQLAPMAQVYFEQELGVVTVVIAATGRTQQVTVNSTQNGMAEVQGVVSANQPVVNGETGQEGPLANRPWTMVRTYERDQQGRWQQTHGAVSAANTFFIAGAGGGGGGAQQQQQGYAGQRGGFGGYNTNTAAPAAAYDDYAAYGDGAYDPSLSY